MPAEVTVCRCDPTWPAITACETCLAARRPRCRTCNGRGFLWMAQFGTMPCGACDGQPHESRTR